MELGTFIAGRNGWIITLEVKTGNGIIEEMCTSLEVYLQR
jgi:hypothetical protein